MAPLVDLTKKNQPSKVCSSQDCQVAFDTVMEVLSSEPVVQLPDFSRQFLIRTDASSRGLGAALMQTDDSGQTLPVLYASRKFVGSRGTLLHRGESLAIVWAINKFSLYLIGREFSLKRITDR